MRDGLVDLPRSKIQIAQDIGGIPIARLVVESRRYSAIACSSFPWRRSFSALRKERGAINGHESINRIKQRLRPERSAMRV